MMAQVFAIVKATSLLPKNLTKPVKFMFLRLSQGQGGYRVNSLKARTHFVKVEVGGYL
jgi:hypothetical protein